MKTETLCRTGLAAAILTCGHAHGADAPVPEPETRDGSGMCNAYGEGYFHMPGTETCMRISGYLRADLKGGDNVYVYKGKNNRNTYAWRTRAELRFQTVADTELGRLLTLVELRNQWDDGADTLNSQLRFGYVQLGGLRAGIDESIFWQWTDYLGKVLNDDIVNPGMYQRTNVISYTFTTGYGFSAIAGLEQGTDSGSDNMGDNYYLPGSGRRIGPNAGAGIKGDPDSRTFHSGSQINGYTPNVLVGARYAQGWGSVAAIGAYDARQEEWAAKLRLNLHVSDSLSLWLMGGYKSHDSYYAYDDIYTARHSNRGRNYYYLMHTSQYADWGGHWAMWGGGAYQLSEKSVFNMQLTFDAADIFSASANVAYKLTPGLVITPEFSYKHYGNNKKWDDGARVSFQGEEAFQGTLRLQRSF